MVVVAKVGDQGGYGQHQEADRPPDPRVAHPQVCTQGANEIKDEADRGGRAQHRHGEADQQSERARGQQDAERNHPSSRHLHLVRDNLHRLGADEVQDGGVAVRERRQDRDDDVDDVHTL